MRTTIILLSVLLVPQLAWSHAFDQLLNTDDIGINKIPHQGVSNILVVPSRVGVGNFPAIEWAKLQSFYAKQGGPGTFRDYWKTVSQGKYDPVPTLVQPVLFPDSCPIPGKQVGNCVLSLDDVLVLFSGGVKAAISTVLGRVRDEQGIDLGNFDINSASGPGADGFFDGVIFDSDIYAGIAFPLNALFNTVTIPASSPSDPLQLTLGIVAMVPPDNHEFAHMFGFIDHYGGPTINCLMDDAPATLSAFNRQQVGWSEVITVKASQVMVLKPVLEGGPILRFGDAPRYVLVENRGGAKHQDLEYSAPGIYRTSIDESTIINDPLGFINLLGGTLYLPNQAPPYLNINLPDQCELSSADTALSCAFKAVGQMRDVVHADGTDLQAKLEIIESRPDGTIVLKVIFDGQPVPDGGIPDTGSSDALFQDAWGVPTDSGIAGDGLAMVDHEVTPLMDGAPPPLDQGSSGCAMNCGTPPTASTLGWIFALCLIGIFMRRRA